jgi:nitroreductase
MEISEAIRTRRSIRAYKPEPVPRQILEEIINTSQWAGSFINMQPWELAVLGGEVMKEWKRRLVAAFEANTPAEREYPVGKMPFPEPYARRAEAFRATIDNTMFPPGAENLEEKQHAYTISGIQVRDAPNAIVILTEKSFLELPLHLMAIGIIAQNICLAALSHGLGTCFMGRPVEMPGLLRELLDIHPSKAVMCVIAMGYPDLAAPINNLVRQRAPATEWVHWYGC